MPVTHGAARTRAKMSASVSSARISGESDESAKSMMPSVAVPVNDDDDPAPAPAGLG